MWFYFNFLLRVTRRAPTGHVNGLIPAISVAAKKKEEERNGKLLSTTTWAGRYQTHGGRTYLLWWFQNPPRQTGRVSILSEAVTIIDNNLAGIMSEKVLGDCEAQLYKHPSAGHISA